MRSNTKLRFLTSKARLAFAKLRQVFIKAPILNYFNLKFYIQVESNVSRYIINRVIN